MKAGDLVKFKKTDINVELMEKRYGDNYVNVDDIYEIVKIHTERYYTFIEIKTLSGIIIDHFFHPKRFINVTREEKLKRILKTE